MAGRHLGSLGTERAERDETFNYFTLVDVRVHPDLTDLLLVEFLRRAGQIDENDPGAMDALMGFFESLVHPDDFKAFWQESLKHRQMVRDLMRTVQQLLEGLSDRPTRGRSGSSAGRPNTARKSRRDSSSRVIRQLEKDGRPDLALVVVQAQEAQRAG